MQYLCKRSVTSMFTARVAPLMTNTRLHFSTTNTKLNYQPFQFQSQYQHHPQRRQFSNEALRPNSEPYDPYKNRPQMNGDVNKNTQQQTQQQFESEPIRYNNSPQQQYPPQQPIPNQKTPSQQANEEIIGEHPTIQPQQQQQQPIEHFPSDPSKPNIFKRNPWILPQLILSTPLIGVIIYQQMLINEIVTHTQSVEQAVEQFGDILEYHHNILGQMVDFPDGGMMQYDDEDMYSSQPPSQGQPQRPDSGPSGAQMARQQQQQQQQQYAPPTPPQQQQQRQPYQPRSGLFPQDSSQQQASPRDTQRVPSGYPFNQQ